jgi:hypothetical protein
MLTGITARGNGNRVTIWIEPTMLGIPFVRLCAKNVHGTSAARVTSA